MTFSILIPSFQQGQYIRQTIDAILRQRYPSAQIIVIDGGSNDDTTEILRSYGSTVQWVSERDEGQADALNKGLHMATGEIIGWINSDDYYGNSTLGEVAREFADSRVKWVVGNITVVYERLGKSVGQQSPTITYRRLLENPDIVRQQGAFFRRSLLDQIGGWNKDFFMTMDFDLWVRLAKVVAPKMVVANWAYFRSHPSQKTSAKNLIRQVQELDRILDREGVSWVRRQTIFARKYFDLVKHTAKLGLINAGVIDESYRHIPYGVRHLQSRSVE